MKEAKRPGRSRTTRSRVPRGDRVDAAYDRLRELIISGKLAPGSRIIETDIAERLEVSRTPVRAALQRLRQDGFIISSDHTSQARLWVAPLSRADARELFAILSECEGLAAAWAAEKPDDARTAVAERLRELNSRLAARGREPDADSHELFAIDQEFHATFFEAGAGPRLTALHTSVKPQAERYLLLYLNALVDRFETSVREHASIAAAIHDGDAQAARIAVATNWGAAGQRLDSVMERLGERGVW
jgi:DNA-binding GntR family transcriptional regulator